MVARNGPLPSPEAYSREVEQPDRTFGGKGPPAYKKCVGEPNPHSSKAINDAMLEYSAKAKYQTANTSEIHNPWVASADQTRATRRDFGDMPIIVLTHAPYIPVPISKRNTPR